MQPLRPTLWRTCRVIANETRLNLLRALFACEESTVSMLAGGTGISISFASIQLRALHARGLVTARSAGRWVFYTAAPNPFVEHAAAIGDAIRTSCAVDTDNGSLIKAATAFTHPRRIIITKCLGEEQKTVSELMLSTHISRMALYRHLEKLTARGMVEQENNRYCLARPENSLGQALLTLARN